MRDRLRAFVTYYVFWVLFFVAQKPLFMLWQYDLPGEVSWTDWFAVMVHGLPLDLSVAGYLTVLYGLLLCVSVWVKGRWLRVTERLYTAIMLAVAIVIVIGDNGCFPSWGYHIDRDIFDYLASPKEVLACAPWSQWLLGFIAMDVLFAVWWIIYRSRDAMHSVSTSDGITSDGITSDASIGQRIGTTAVLLLLTALLFLPIRGSVTVSTMNTGRVYFSENRMLNLAAVNPVFNLVESLSENTLDNRRYRYMPSEEAEHVFRDMHAAEGEPCESILTTDRPNIVLIILESFGKSAWRVMPNMQRLAAEGVYFSNIYANSYRTDRGVMAVLGAFPGSATTSIMTVPSISARLPQVGQVLKDEGYDLKFYYGGDEDFTNMRSYLMTGGFEQRVCDHDFPLKDRMSKWGVPDHILFDYAARDIRSRDVMHSVSTRQSFDVILSLSSHEPFEVPYDHYEQPFLNAVAYTDSCLGAFVDALRNSPAWDKTLLVLMADHGYPFPKGMPNYDPRRYAIPLVMAGGAIREPHEVNTLGSQIDWVPTVLHQMGLPAAQFTFAKDLLNPDQTPYAYYNFVDGFALITPSDTTIIDAVTNTPLTVDTINITRARAITQLIYEGL